MRIRSLRVVAALMVLAFAVMEGAANGEDLDQVLCGKSEAPQAEAPFAPPPLTFLSSSSSCWAALLCDDNSIISCSCPAPAGGTCNDYPTGTPWGGYVLCQCTGSPYVQEHHCNAPTCTQQSCDTQCAGPGNGRCDGNTCYCL